MNESFKFYKNKTKEFDLSNVIDCSDELCNQVNNIFRNYDVTLKF